MRPSITLTASPGSTLICNPGQWSDADFGLTYAWTQGQTARSTQPKIVLDSDWFGSELTCRVTASEPGGNTSASAAVSLPRLPIKFRWVSPASRTTVSGVTTLYGQALTDPNGTARIKSWCVSIDGFRLTTNAAIYESVDYARNDLNFAAAFSPATGCFTSSGEDLRDGFLTFDTTAWNGPRTFTVTVTDSSDRTATSPP